MDIEANWKQICELMLTDSPDMEILYDLTGEGMVWFYRDGFAPKSLGGNRTLAKGIYKCLRSVAVAHLKK